MDKKKLMQILLRDAKEMEQLVSDIKTSKSFDDLEIELLLTRASGIRHLLEMAGENETLLTSKGSGVSAALVTSVYEPPRTIIPEPVAVQQTVPKIASQNILEPAAEPKKAEKEKTVGNIVEAIQETVENDVLDVQPPSTKKLVVKEKVQEIMETTDAAVMQPEDIDNDEVELIDVAAQIHDRQTVGEKFVAGKSVNDILLKKGKNDYKFSNLPLGNLQAGIGINDRFLFIREMFEGNSELFLETVKKIDAMHSLHEAAIYLRENFKWKKSETSLKFVELVKRRFIQ